MVDIVGRAKVIVEGDVDTTSVEKTGATIGSALKKGAVIGVAALGTLAVAGVKAFKAFEDAESVSNKLGNVLGNMGVGDAAAQVEKLADSLQRATGVDDELIKGGETVLATFSSVAKTAGEVGGTFERATRASVDLAAAGFGSVQSASVMLGKALQDPEKGISALSRAGVTFSEVQKQQIKNFVDTGDVAAAQNLILQEVEKQVSGTAEAGATATGKMAAGLDEVQESVGNLLSVLVEGGEKNKDFSDSLFTIADQLNKLANSKSFKLFASQLGDAAENVGTLAGYMNDLIGYGDSLAKKWPSWGSAIKKFSNPLGTLLDSIELAKRGLDRLGITGDGPTLKGSSKKDLLKLLVNGELASGGPVNQSGLYLVGENGPEIAALPAGSHVYNNEQSRAMAGGGTTLIFNEYGPRSGSEKIRNAEWWTRYGSRNRTSLGVVG